MLLLFVLWRIGGERIYYAKCFKQRQMLSQPPFFVLLRNPRLVYQVKD